MIVQLDQINDLIYIATKLGAGVDEISQSDLAKIREYLSELSPACLVKFMQCEYLIVFYGEDVGLVKACNRSQQKIQAYMQEKTAA